MRVIIGIVALGLLLAVQAAVTSPLVLYTDVVSGPTSGGENNLGCYLSIFGKNFGASLSAIKVYIGTSEVANYRFLGLSKVYDKTNIQHIAVQVGSLGGAAQGVALPIKVVVNGVPSNTDHTFMPNPGNIYFASLTGSDTTGAANDITKPYRHLQLASDMTAAIHGQLHAGDHVVIRGGQWSDALGYDTAWLRFRYPQQQGSLPTGQRGTGWIHFTAYPGAINGNGLEDVHYSTPANTKGGFHGANSAYAGTTGDFVTVSNIRFDMDANALRDAAPTNLQYSNGAWRIVNNDIGPWPSVIDARAGGISGGADGLTILGNHIHDISRPTNELLNHGIYVDSFSQNTNIGYNWIHNITGGNIIQFYDSAFAVGTEGWPGFANMQIHHNWLEKCAKHALNLADATLSARVWNNVVLGADQSGIRFNAGYLDNIDVLVAFNTFYDNARASIMGIVTNSGGASTTGAIKLVNNIVAAGPNTLSSTAYYINNGADTPLVQFANNLYYDNNFGWVQNDDDARGMYGNPLFNNPTTSDFSLKVTSPAVDKGDSTLNSALPVLDDFTVIVLRDSKPDLGALEYVSLTTPTSAPTSTPVATPVATPHATPVATPVAAPLASPKPPTAPPTAVPVATPHAAPVAAPLASPKPPTAPPTSVPVATPHATPVATPVAAPKPPVAPPTTVPVVTPHATPVATPVAAPLASPKPPTAPPTTVPVATPHATPVAVPLSSPKPPTAPPTTVPVATPSSVPPTSVPSFAPLQIHPSPLGIPFSDPLPSTMPPPSSLTSTPAGDGSAQESRISGAATISVMTLLYLVLLLF